MNLMTILQKKEMIKRTNLRVKQHLEPLIEKAFFEMRKRA